MQYFKYLKSRAGSLVFKPKSFVNTPKVRVIDARTDVFINLLRSISTNSSEPNPILRRRDICHANRTRVRPSQCRSRSVPTNWVSYSGDFSAARIWRSASDRTYHLRNNRIFPRSLPTATAWRLFVRVAAACRSEFLQSDNRVGQNEYNARANINIDPTVRVTAERPSKADLTPK